MADIAALAAGRPVYLNRRDAAAYIAYRTGGPLSPDALAQMKDRGPPYRIFRGSTGGRTNGGGNGRRAMYTQLDIDDWIEAKMFDPTGVTDDQDPEVAGAGEQEAVHSSHLGAAPITV